MRTLTRAAASVCLAVALAACGSGNMNPDTGDMMDTGTGNDATPQEGGDTSMGAMCNGVAIENLNMLGMTAGGTLTYTGSNAMASAQTNTGLQIPSELRVDQGCPFLVAHQRVFQYMPASSGVIELSTSNMGTDPGLDTVIVVANTMCRARPVVNDLLNCNDDDGTFVNENRRLSSRTRAQVTAGTPILIAVGTFAPLDAAATDMHGTGNFTLTVKTIPSVADGQACDITGEMNTCAGDATCRFNDYPPTSGTCRTPGSGIGAECASGTPLCATGLLCDTSGGAPGICVRGGVAAGMRCDPLNHCADGNTCVGDGTLAAPSGTCRANGSVPGSLCATGNTCMNGMVCGPPSATNGDRFCGTAAGPLNSCNATVTACADTSQCINAAPFGIEGTCTAQGGLRTTCTPGSMCMGTGVTCQSSGTSSFCLRTAASGMPCGNDSQCGAGLSCRLSGGDSAEGRCVPDGALLGNCRASGAACDSGLECSDPMVPSEGVCIRAMGASGSCGIGEGCADGQSCVFDGTMFPAMLRGTCRALGTAGAQCRSTGMPCDAGLTCSANVPSSGICQAAATGACDPVFGSNRCATGQVCRATAAATGSCAAPTAETDGSNNLATAAQMVTLPAAVTGALEIGDVDCVRFAVPANGRVYAQVNDPTGTCSYTADVRMVLYRLGAAGSRPTPLGFGADRFGCGRIDPALRPWAAGLAAGDYAVCISDDSADRSRVPGYVLSVAASM